MTHLTFLSDAEVSSLTGKVRRSAQVRALRVMCIEHRVRPDGSVAVLRAHIDKVFDGGSTSTPRKANTKQPNWEAI